MELNRFEDRTYSVAEYLELLVTTEAKLEFHQGRIVHLADPQSKVSATSA
ncbi:MAG: hypothetical protein AAF828_04595 [Bacteroidota bacterium]